MFQPLGAVDYLYLAQMFHTIAIRDVPQLDLDSLSPMRRFITLIDTLYDNKVNHIGVIFKKNKLLLLLILR